MNANTQTIIQGAIPLIVPLAIALAKAEIPKLPGWILPLLSTVLGVICDQGATALTGTSSPWWVGAILGAAGVGVRELKDQVHQRLITAIGPSTPLAPSKLGLWIGLLGLSCLMVGCTFANNAHKTINSAAIMADGGMQTYGSYWKDQVVKHGDSPSLERDKTNMMALSFKVGSSLAVADRALQTYEGKVGTNTTTKAVVSALIQTAIQDAGNFVAEVGIVTGNTNLLNLH